jgi:hypothetical protein
MTVFLALIECCGVSEETSPRLGRVNRFTSSSQLQQLTYCPDHVSLVVEDPERIASG